MTLPAKLTILLAALWLPPSQPPERISFAELADFEYVEGMDLPRHVTALHGKRIRISGFMRSESGTDGATDQFLLISDSCGCEGTPFLNEILFCFMPEGQTTEILPGTTNLTGTIWVGEEREDGVVLSIYTMDVETVED